MNRDEAIKKLRKAGNISVAHAEDLYESIVPRPVVPQYVADWLEYCKSNKLTLLGSFDPISEHGIGLANTFKGEVLKGIDWARRNQDTFVRAWLDGYTVEQEKLYTVEIPNPNRVTEPIIYLSRGEEGKILLNTWAVYVSQNWKNQPHAQLTESEIKEDFDWAWPFAKEVE